MRTNSRDEILNHSLDVLRAGESLTLESAAHQAGLTKPGLMYHFGTKEALMTALVDHVIDRYETELNATAGAAVAELSASERLLAYLQWSLSATFDAADLVMVADPKLREPMTQQWGERLNDWIAVSADLPAAERARLNAIRLIADGSWYADASNCAPLPRDERHHVYELAREILGVA